MWSVGITRIQRADVLIEFLPTLRGKDERSRIMRFVLTLEDVIWLILLAVTILILLVGLVSSWAGKLGEKIINKTTKSRAKGADDEDN